MVTRIGIFGVAVLGVVGCAQLIDLQETADPAPCTPTQTRCLYNQPQYCSSDLEWVDKHACDEGKPVCSGNGECVAVAEVRAGNSHTCAILEDGTLRCWGRNDQGQVGDGSTAARHTPVRVYLPGSVSKIALGGGDEVGTTCAVVEGGLWCWGDNYEGQIRPSDRDNVTRPLRVEGLSDVVDVTLGYRHICALHADGTVSCWGNSVGMQAGDSGDLRMEVPTKVPGIKGAVQVVAGVTHSCARTEEHGVWCWGLNTMGQSGQPHGGTVFPPQLVPGTEYATSLAAGRDHSCAVIGLNKILCWGRDDCGQLGDGKIDCEDECLSHTTTCGTDGPQEVVPPIDATRGWVEVTAGMYHTCVRPSGDVERVVCWGRNDFFQAGVWANVQAEQGTAYILWPASTNILHATGLSSGAYHVCATTSSGPVRCWGRNDFGQLGDGGSEFSFSSAVVF